MGRNLRVLLNNRGFQHLADSEGLHGHASSAVRATNPTKGDRQGDADRQVAASSSSLTAPLRRFIFATSRAVTSGLLTKKRSHSKANLRSSSTDLRSCVPLNPSHTP